MMSEYNHNVRVFLVRNTRGRTVPVQVSLTSESPDDLVRRIQETVEEIHVPLLSNNIYDSVISVYTSNGKRVFGRTWDRTLLSKDQPPVVTLHCHLPLLGGKGGFGSNLKAASKKIKSIDNVDACRDLQGRRVRYRTAEEKLKKWKDEAGERELEKVALDYMKQASKDEIEKKIASVPVEDEVERVKQLKRKMLDDVKGAVSVGLMRKGGNGSSVLDTTDAGGGVGDERKDEEQKKRKKFAAFDQDSSSSGSDSDE
jgi:hypothetical protein